jgi:hypothetical protein
MVSLRERPPAEANEALEVIAAPQAPCWSTRARWLSWWRSGLFSTSWFAVMRAQFATPVEPSRSPDSLLAQFAGSVRERIAHLLVMLGPLTTLSMSPQRSRIALVV